MSRVTFEGKRFPILDGETVLQALLRGGAVVPFSCRKGTCHSCMMRVEEGDPGRAAQAGVRQALVNKGYFLPCASTPQNDLTISRPDPSQLFLNADVITKDVLAPGIVRLRLEVEQAMSWRPGQYVNVRIPSGSIRSYSIVSREEDYFLELHVQRVEGGEVSSWIVDEADEESRIEVQGPHGATCYSPENPHAPLLLLATGTGLAPMLGILRDALDQGHRGKIFLYHGARAPGLLYLRAELQELQSRFATFHYIPCASRRSTANITFGRVTDVAFSRHPSLAGWITFIAGNPDMVADARRRALFAGISRNAIHADPFLSAHTPLPNDGQKLAETAPDPELWEALGRGIKLRAILTDFYTRVYGDPRLAPFFHKVTIERAIDKQYAFLADVMTGERSYFGLKPFNAHHWMIISDELFDYREVLLEECMHRAGLPLVFVRRWSDIHERFRAEIVKSRPRGMIVNGAEITPMDGFREELIEVATICDGCSDEIRVGATARLHTRTGELFCASCGARAIGMTQPPPGVASEVDE